jgi:hypothetical protein
VRQFEADQRMARQPAGIAPTLHRAVEQASVDDSMHLSQWHAGNGRGLIGRHQCGVLT